VREDAVDPGATRPARLDPEHQGWLLEQLLLLADALPQHHSDDIAAPPFRVLVRS